MRQLWDLWSQWWSGEPLASSQLWGLPLIAWARIGKLLQFLAGLAVVLDLIGPEALRAFGKRLSSVRPAQWSETRWFERVAKVVFEVAVAVGGLLCIGGSVVALAPAYSSMTGEGQDSLIVAAGRQLYGSGWILPIAVVCLAGGLFFAILVAKDSTDAKPLTIALSALLFAPFTIPVIVLVVAFAPLALFIYGVCLPIIYGLAWLLDRNRPAHPARWVALILFIVGFHFDLLTT